MSEGDTQDVWSAAMAGSALDALLVFKEGEGCVQANGAAARMFGPPVPGGLDDPAWPAGFAEAARSVLASGIPRRVSLACRSGAVRSGAVRSGGATAEAALSRFVHDGVPHLMVVCRDADPPAGADGPSLLMDALVETMPIPVFYKDAAGRYLGCNRAFETFFGSAKRDLVGKTVFEIAPPDNARKYHEADEALLKGGGTQIYEWDVRRANGEDRRVVFHKARFFRPDGTVGGLVGAVLDVTERLEAETELRRSNADLEQFAYVVSHDLGQPLRMVAAYLDLLERRAGPSLDPESREFLAFALDGARRMGGMITDLLDYCRVGRGARRFRTVDLAEAVADARFTLSLAASECAAQILVAPDLPRIKGDRAELGRLFQNLVGNAIKYRRPGVAPRVEIAHRAEAEDWHVWVEDNGIGIPPHQRDLAFALFRRLAPDDAREGTGVGLALCRRIVERHGGRIWIEDAPGGGCRVVMTFPR